MKTLGVCAACIVAALSMIERVDARELAVETPAPQLLDRFGPEGSPAAALPVEATRRTIEIIPPSGPGRPGTILFGAAAGPDETLPHSFGGPH